MSKAAKLWFLHVCERLCKHAEQYSDVSFSFNGNDFRMYTFVKPFNTSLSCTTENGDDRREIRQNALMCIGEDLSVSTWQEQHPQDNWEDCDCDDDCDDDDYANDYADDDDDDDDRDEDYAIDLNDPTSVVKVIATFERAYEKRIKWLNEQKTL